MASSLPDLSVPNTFRISYESSIQPAFRLRSAVCTQNEKGVTKDQYLFFHP